MEQGDEAGETGLDEREWHGEADRREHTLTPDEVDRLARHLGHPRYDPHGDPIPTARGHIAPFPGIPLTDYPVGAEAEVTHLEDEPPGGSDASIGADAWRVLVSGRSGCESRGLIWQWARWVNGD